MRYLGVDLAWSDSTRARETGVAALESDGQVLAAGWTVGVAETIAWLEQHAGGEALAFVDAPLLVLNQPQTQRMCEKQVGQRYSRWKVSANSTNLGTRHLAGVALRSQLEARGWAYDDGLRDSLPEGSRLVSECYPYTTIVGARELGYDHERLLYKRKPRQLPTAPWRPMRAAACDELVRRIDALSAARPPPDLRSNPVTQSPLEPSPHDDRALVEEGVIGTEYLASGEPVVVPECRGPCGE